MDSLVLSNSINTGRGNVDSLVLSNTINTGSGNVDSLVLSNTINTSRKGKVRKSQDLVSN